MQIPHNQEESDMNAPTHPITPLRQIAIILAHCIMRIHNKLTLAGGADWLRSQDQAGDGG